MEILINIPLGLKMVFEHENWTALDCMEMKKALMNGVVLPKGHGRLIDADALEKKMCDRETEIGDDKALWESSAVSVALDMFAPTVIEADKE